MKNLILTIVITLIFYNSNAGNVNTLIRNNGSWDNSTSWSLGRPPGGGDTVVIPQGLTVSINSDVMMASEDIYIKIYGVFKMFNAVVDFGNNTTIVIYGSGSVTYVSDGKISIGSVLKFDRNGTISGLMFADQTTSSEPFGFEPFSTLPVKFLGFTTTYSNRDVLIQWSTSQEILVGIFQVERSFNTTVWTSVAQFKSTGNSNHIKNYKYTDKNVSAQVVYYRIKVIDTDGKITYSAIKKVVTEKNSTIHIASVQQHILLQFAAEIKGDVKVQVISLSGQVVDEQIIRNPVGQVVLNSKMKGSCVVSLSNDQLLHVARQIIL